MAAQDAELKLKVSLDLAFFRQQLAGLGAATAGTPLPVQVKFDRRSVQNELNALGANIRKRNYRLNIQTNLEAEINKAKTLAKEFQKLEQGAFASPQPRQRGSFTKSAFRGMDLGDIRKLYKEAANAGLLSYDEAIAKNRRKIEEALYGLGKDSIAGLLNGLKSDNEKLKAAAKALGKDLISSVKAVLGIASPSREFKKIGEDSGEGLELGLKSGIGEATRIGIKEMRDLFRALQNEAQSGAARLQATMLGAMAGIVQLPGGRQQRQRLQQTGGAINNAMTGGALRNIQTRQRGVRSQTEAASAATPAFMTALPMMFGMSERELMSRLQGLYGQQYRAPSIDGGGAIPNQIGTLISSITGTRGPLGTGGGVIGQLFKGGAVNPGVLSSGYIGRTALSAGFVNYPPGMPSAYESGFIGGGGGSYQMARGKRLEPQVLGVFASEIKQAQQAVANFRYSLNKQQLALPAAGQTRLSQAQAARVQQAYQRSAERGARVFAEDRMYPTVSGQVPLSGGGPFLPPGGPGGPFGGGGGGGRFGGFGRAMGFGPTPSPIDLSVFQQARLPLTGAIAELTSEFANATKQVLLFGTAYKALAFFINLPGEAFEAAKALATYKNQLQAVTSESNTFEQSFAFVDNLAQRFNVPLESARQGFVKLYASMQPAGFEQGQIENLFEGVSKATAAFGLSADKVDRVNYAFAQMASKGQIMSEELKGQLGDVLPGALALFAQAAQMSIPEFSKAMEDGAFKGKAMMQVLDNVAVLMNSKFGPAAQNASKTLQGALNEMQNNLKAMYESLSPFVDQFAAAFGPQINSLIGDVTSAVKALTGTFTSNSDVLSTLSPRAEALYNTFQLIGPSITNAAANIGNFASSLQVLVGPLFTITKGLLDFISLPVVARVGLYATIIASLNGAFQLLARTGILQATVAMVKFLATLNIAQLRVYIAGLQTLVAVLRSMVTAANIAKAAVVGLKVALGGIIVTAIFTGLDLLAQRLLNIGDSANQSRQSVRELMQELDRIAGSADVEAGTKAYLDANTKLAAARKANEKALEDLARAKETAPDAPSAAARVEAAQKRADQAYDDVLQARREVNAARKARDTAVQRQEEERNRTQQQLQPVDLAAGDGKTKKEKELDQYNQSQLKFIQQRFDKNKQLLDQQLQENLLSKTSYDIKLAELTLEAKKAEITERARLESEKINKANFSAADKALALKDVEISKANELAFAEKQRDISVKGAKMELRQPFVEALRNENIEIDKQNALLGRLKEGYSTLTPEQEASFIIEEKIAALKADEQRLIQSDIDNLKKQIQLRLENLKILQKEEALRSARQELGVIGAGLRAGFAGSAASVFERTMVETEGDIGQATKLAEIETKAMQMRSVFEGIQGAIDGISGAFASMMTEGVTALITGTATAKEVFASFLQSVAQALQQAAAQMIATYIAIGLAKIFAGLGSKGADPLEGVGGADWMKYTSAKGSYFDGPTAFFADGGIVSSPTFFQFADGGKINMGLMGEAGPEAIMPLKRGPDGRLGVSMYDASRKAVANAGGNANMDTVDDEDSIFSIGSPSAARRTVAAAAEAVAATRMQVMEQRTLSERRSEMRHIEELVAKPAKINVEYQSQVINNVEYVTRDQAERMAAQSALRGRELALSSLQNSVKARKRVGMG
jgi:tape measure domain-containing protein